MGRIDREDMLELTRRMTLKRSCFSRVAGAYLDEEGYIDGTFNTNFLRLSERERERNLQVAKAIPFAETNVQLKDYRFTEADERPGKMWHLLMALRACELKNDILLDSFYEHFGERYRSDHPYAIRVYFGNYDVPLKAKDKASLWESEEVYQFMVCAIGPLLADYEMGEPECGFLFPAFTERSTDVHGIAIFHADPRHPHKELVEEIIF
jgi:hypothetical protein